MAFSRLQGAIKARQWDRVKNILGKGAAIENESRTKDGDSEAGGHILAKLYPPAGFGELSTLTGVKMAVTVRASWSNPQASIENLTTTSAKLATATATGTGTGTGTGTAAATTSSSKGHFTDLLVVPKEAMLACVAARRSSHALAGTAPSEGSYDCASCHTPSFASLDVPVSTMYRALLIRLCRMLCELYSNR